MGPALPIGGLMSIYHDNGKAIGRPTKFFRDSSNGVEQIPALDWIQGSQAWTKYSAKSIADLKAQGMFLSRLDNQEL